MLSTDSFIGTVPAHAQLASNTVTVLYNTDPAICPCCVQALPLSAVACSVPGLSTTAVGARRQLVLGVFGIEEDVGMLNTHSFLATVLTHT
jgi:hypothetical protein